MMVRELPLPHHRPHSHHRPNHHSQLHHHHRPRPSTKTPIELRRWKCDDGELRVRKTNVSPTMRRVQSSKSCLKKQQGLNYSGNGRGNYTPPRMRKNVSFDTIEIKEFPMELGDNPSARNGIPVQLGWKSHRTRVLDLDSYESRANKKTDGKKKPIGIIPPRKRLGLVQSQGATIDEIANVTYENKLIRQSRSESVNSMHLDRYHERVESVQRKFAKLKKAASWTSPSASSASSPMPMHNNNNPTTTRTTTTTTSLQTMGGGYSNATFAIPGGEKALPIHGSKLRQMAGIPLSQPRASLSETTQLRLKAVLLSK